MDSSGSLTGGGALALALSSALEGELAGALAQVGDLGLET